MTLITGPILKQICPKVHKDRAELLAKYLNEICPLYGINTTDIFHEFFANLVHECGEFTRYEESLNYSSEALIKMFGRHRISIEDANRYGRTATQPANQSAIANIIYGGTFGKNQLGNEQPGDGFAFRGSGPIQMTGRANFMAFALWMRRKFNIIKSLQEWAILLRSNDEYAIHSACWIFAISKKLIDEAEADNMKEIVKRINGGFIGMDDRLKYYELSKKLIA
jgi:putative chitinase